MKSPALQNDIIAHLRASARPESSRSLAARFLRIEGADEATCRRLLGPLLQAVPGLVHREGEGWILQPVRSAASAAGAPAAPPRSMAPSGPVSGSSPTVLDTEREAASDVNLDEAPLGDFVALATEGGGPGGSGELRAASLLPFIDGEECQEEHFPAWAADGEETVVSFGDATGEEGDRGAGMSVTDLESLVEAVGDLPVVCHRVGREFEPLRRASANAGLAFQPPVVSAAKLGHLLLGLKANHAAVDLAAHLGVESRGPDDCRGRVRMVAACFVKMLPLLERKNIHTLRALLEFQDMPAAPLDFTPYAFSADDLRQIPQAPGVYRFLDRQGEVIYVGKSKSLRSRVASYFTTSSRATAKGRMILDQTRSLDYQTVASELEALLLESALLLEHRPRLNRQFDVHERPAPYGPRLNIVVVLPDRPREEVAAGEPRCTVHLLRQGRYLGRVRGLPATTAHPAWREVREAVERTYFPPSGAGSFGGRTTDAMLMESPAGDPGFDWQLAASFLRRHRDEVNVLDLDECAALDDAMRRLGVLAGATLSGAGRVVAR